MDRDLCHGDRAVAPLFNNVNKAHRQGSFPPHRHRMAELYVCLGGSATDDLDRSTHTVHSGDVFVHTADGIHTQRDVSDFRCCIFQFHMDRLTERAAEIGLAELEGYRALFSADGHRHELCLDLDTVRFAEQMADILAGEGDPATQDLLFLSLLSVIAVKCRPRSVGGISPAEGDVGDVIYYMERHYGEELSLERLAALSHYSRRHLTRLFRERTGMAPMAYLDALRIRAACDLLLHTAHRVGEIAALCGFTDANLFSRHFRIQKGMSPSAYRRRHTGTATFRGVDVRGCGDSSAKRTEDP